MFEECSLCCERLSNPRVVSGSFQFPLDHRSSATDGVNTRHEWEITTDEATKRPWTPFCTKAECQSVNGGELESSYWKNVMPSLLIERLALQGQHFSSNPQELKVERWPAKVRRGRSWRRRLPGPMPRLEPSLEGSVLEVRPRRNLKQKRNQDCWREAKKRLNQSSTD